MGGWKDKEKERAWREAHREKIALVNKRWRQKNSKLIEARKKARRAANPERTREEYRQWRNSRKEKRLEENRKRRAAKRDAAVYLTEKEKETLLLLERTRRELQKETGRKYHLDHIIPIACGGVHHPINLRILEGSENESKQAKILPEAIPLATETFRLYYERISPERAWTFMRQFAKSLGFGEDEINQMIEGKPLKKKPTLEDFME